MAAAASGRPAHLLEKDVWVVRALQTLFGSPLADRLVFKGGTSLSKAYRVIRRFSEDVDLTCDIRAIAPDLTKGTVIPVTRSQERKWSKEIRKRLPDWLEEHVLPILDGQLHSEPLVARIWRENERILIGYQPLAGGTGYVNPTVQLEFGGRSTGEPHTPMPIVCDAAEHLPMLSFPAATPNVMHAERTFWEKATAIHVYCLQGRFRGSQGFARHWYDLVRLDDAGLAEAAQADRPLAKAVAMHKSMFFQEKNTHGEIIDYLSAVGGHLRLAPEGKAAMNLQDDYERMIDDGLFFDDPEPFEVILERCRELERRLNAAALASLDSAP